MTVTDLFGVRTFAEEIYVQTAGGPVWDLGRPADVAAGSLQGRSFAFAVLVVALALLPALWWCARPIRQWRPSPMRRWTIAPRRGAPAMGAAVLALWAALFGLPLGSLFYHAGSVSEATDSGYFAYWSLAASLSAIVRAPLLHAEELVHTGAIAAAAAMAATLVAAGLGVWATRGTVGKAVAFGLAAILAALPGPLVGVWLIRLLNQPPDSPLSFLTALYDEAAFGFAPWLAQTLRTMPFAIIVIVPAMLATPRGLLDSAALDGVGPRQLLWHVFVPLHWRSLLAGWLVALVLAIGELPATILVAPPGVTPLSVRMFNLVHYGVDDQLAGLALFLWGCVLLGTCSIAWLVRQASRAANAERIMD
jgi:iron(III) transport system permease protein